MRPFSMVFALIHVLTTRLVLGSRLYGVPFLNAELRLFKRVVVDVWAVEVAARGAFEAFEYTDMRELLTKLIVAAGGLP